MVGWCRLVVRLVKLMSEGHLSKLQEQRQAKRYTVHMLDKSTKITWNIRSTKY